MQNSNNSNYYKLKADEYAILMRECFEESQNTWKRGDKAKAKEFSTKGNDYKNLLAEANKQFCEIFKFEKEQKRNVNFKEHIIDEIVKEKNLKDSKKLNNHDLLITDFDNFENNITVEKIEQTACEVNDFNMLDAMTKYHMTISTF